MPNTNLKHIGLIMDGNRRWAKQNKKTVKQGHLEGYKTLRSILPVFKEENIDFISVYAFSNENWSRSSKEVEELMSLARWVFKKEIKSLSKENIRIKVIGSQKRVPDDIVQFIKKAELDTADNNGGTLVICFNYGGKQEIVDAVNNVVARKREGDEVTVQDIEQNLYSSEIPPVDLLIRTSGEQRTSGFMLWRSEYSELMFMEKMWPDLEKQDVQKAISEYNSRDRRFGK